MRINDTIEIPDDKIQISAIRAQGAGGQNVNKVSSAVHLRFHIPESDLPEDLKERLLSMRDKRISKDGFVVIKAQRFKSLDQNRIDALTRLKNLIQKALDRQKPRKPTRPTRAAKRKRLDEKSKRSRVKQLRRPIDPGQDR